MRMASMLMPRCPLIKPHFHTWPATITLRSTVFLRTAARMESSTAANDSTSSAKGTEADTVVQYVVLRRDLIDTWPLGSVVTQGCHASVAAIWTHKDDPHTLFYCSPPNIDSMHKVTLEVKGETQLLNLSEKLKAGGIAHKLWIEQPENFPTCLATKPYPKSTVSSFFKKLKLCHVHPQLSWYPSSESENVMAFDAQASPGISSFTLNLDDVHNVFSGSSSKRPIGVKKAKLKRRKDDNASSIINIMQEGNKQFIEKLKKSNAQIQHHLEIQNKKYALKEENKILFKDLNSIQDLKIRAFVQVEQARILQNRAQQQDQS